MTSAPNRKYHCFQEAITTESLKMPSDSYGIKIILPTELRRFRFIIYKHQASTRQLRFLWSLNIRRSLLLEKQAYSQRWREPKTNQLIERIWYLDRKSTRLNSSHVKISYA